MPLRIVQSKQNSRLKELRRAMSHPGRDGTGLVGIEGPNLVAEALRAGLRIHGVFIAKGSEHLLDPLGLTPEINVLVMPLELLTSALATETPQPIAALIHPPEWTWTHLLGCHRKTPPLIVVLAGLQDPGNLGAILRSTEAFGGNGILSLPGTVSAWNPKTIRASAGSVFRVPLLPATVDECFTRLREASVKVFSTVMRGAAPAELMDLEGPVALIIGNEGNGVPEELAARAGGTITIPCPGSVESLNAAVAAGILLYEASRQRAAAAARGGKR